MVAVDSKPVTRRVGKARFIYICGCDGTGKSTQARQVLTRLAETGRPAVHLWLRFPFFFSLPLLVYARWQGYSRYEETQGVRHGYWDFRDSPTLRALLPWTLLLDAALAALRKVYVPLWRGQTVVCERFVLDMLVDLAVACGDCSLYRRLPGRLYPRLLPRRATIIVLDLDTDTIRARRADLQSDRQLGARLEAFRRLSATQSWSVLSSRADLAELSRQIWETIIHEQLH